MMSLKTVVTTTTETVIAPKVAKQLLTELEGYALAGAEAKVYTTIKNDHSAAVLELALEGVDGDKFSIGEYKVAVVKGAKNKRLNQSKLIKRMVGDGKYSMKAAIALLEDCTDESPKKDHVRITVKGEKEDDEQ
jgi:flagellar hook assembly protein FlgD